MGLALAAPALRLILRHAVAGQGVDRQFLELFNDVALACEAVLAAARRLHGVFQHRSVPEVHLDPDLMAVV